MKKVETTTVIRTTPSTIISAFIDPTILREWWGVQRTLIETKPGGVYTLAWNISDNGLGYVSTGIIKEYEPNSLLVVGNFAYLNPAKSFLGPMTLTISAKPQPQGEGAELYLCQDGYQSGGDWDWYYEAVTEAWPVVVKTIKDYLEKK